MPPVFMKGNTMKKIFILTVALALAACAQTANTSNAKLNTCLTTKAYNALNEGKLATTGVKTLAKEISKACLKELALEKAGLNEESVTAATNLLTALKGTTTK